MRTALLLLVTLALSSLAPASAGERWTLRPDGYGPAKVGMNLAQLSKVLHERMEKPSDPDEQTCFYATSNAHTHVSFMIEDGKLSRIDVNAPGIFTAEGIQVGDTEAKVRKVYGKRVKVTEHKYIDNGHYLTVLDSDRHYGTRFETDGHIVTAFYAGTAEAIQYVEGCL